MRQNITTVLHQYLCFQAGNQCSAYADTKKSGQRVTVVKNYVVNNSFKLNEKTRGCLMVGAKQILVSNIKCQIDPYIKY